MALAIKTVHLIVVRVIVAFHREVLLVALKVHSLMAQDFLFLHVITKLIKELMVCERCIMEQIHKQEVVIDKNTGDERVWEVIDRHRVVVHAQLRVDVERGVLNLLLAPVLFPKDPDPK
jgi:hypothetical protein